MKKSILTLSGAKELSKNEQKNISGGITFGHLNGYEYGSDYCKCYEILYQDSPGGTVSTTPSDYVVGWSAISPVPACCL